MGKTWKKRKKTKQKRKRERPRLLVEWICAECREVHRISFPYSLKHLRAKGKAFKIKWGGRGNIKRLEIDYRTPLTKMNDFINSLFSQKFKAKKYVKIYYPEKLINLLKRNEIEKSEIPI